MANKIRLRQAHRLHLRPHTTARGGHNVAGLAGFGDVTQEGLRAAFDKTIAGMRAQFEAAANTSMYYKAIAPWLAKTTRNLVYITDGTVHVSDSEREDLTGIEARLRALRNAAKLLYDGGPNDPPPDIEEAIAAVAASINWAAALMGSTLASGETKAAIVKNLAHKLTPTGILEEAGALVSTAVKQAAGALSLPTWAIPLGVGVLALVLIANLSGSLKALIPRRGT